ncbi:CABO-like protein [Mya arenaria]|uniref:CABO-like protein n=1 Tax=Mya arenaria TaxID=6604 RepID=A0ABY7F9E5_MYAAR|nr:calmodulin-like [Mya arenaria]WAR18802.1 CABO-like protein [Mya arenaria]
MAQSLEDYFNDGNPDGEPIDRQQAYNALCYAGHNPMEEELAVFWKEKGKQEGDTITLAELEELAGSLGNPMATMTKALAAFDKNGNGKIEVDELKAILKAGDFGNSGIGDDDEIIQSIFDQADDGDGHLDIDELAKMLCQKLEASNEQST